MKKSILFLLFLIQSLGGFGQYTTNPSSIGFNNASFSSCGTNQFCDYNYTGNEIKMFIDRIVGNTAYFRVVKCATSASPLNVPQFSTFGYIFLKRNSVCGMIENQVVVNGSATYYEMAVTLNPNQSLTDYYAIYIPNYDPGNPYGNYARYGSGKISITGSNTSTQLFEPQLTYPSSGQQLAVTGNVTLQWNKNGNPSGTDYQIRLHNLTDDNYPLDYISVGDVSSKGINVFFGKSYQWVVRAVKSGYITSESAPSTFQIDNLALNVGSNGHSPASGIQNTTHFTFNAFVTNVNAPPYAAPTVDLEFKRPDSSTYTVTDITRTTGYNYEHTQVMQASGTYQYRFIAYQGSRTPKATTWYNLTVDPNSSVSVSSPQAASTYQTNTNLPINWAFTGYSGNTSIELTQGSTSTTAFRVIVDPTTNPNNFNWTIPNDIPAGQYRVKVYNTGSANIIGYSGVFNIGVNANCPNCITGVTESSFTQTGNEGFCAAQYLCSKGIIQSAQTNPSLAIIREDVAKILLLGLLTDNVNFGTLSLPSDNFTTPFNDLTDNGSVTSYHRYAKALSYLQYANNTVTPFDRNRASFKPADGILRIEFIKAILEAWNEPLNSSATLNFSDVSTLSALQLSYLRKAVELNIISNGTPTAPIAFRPNEFTKREEAFLILSRLRQLKGNKSSDIQNVVNYYVPFKYNIENVSLTRDMSEGNFSYFGEAGFEIPDIGFSLGFDFGYQSSLTELPDIWKNVQPLGNGWTHRYNAYIFTTIQQSLSPTNAIVGKPLLVVAWGDGSFDAYDNTTPTNPSILSIGNYNTLTYVSSTQYTIRTKAQVTYTFTKQGSEAGLFRLSAITDRYGNALSLAYKTGASVPFSSHNMVVDYVQAPSGRRATFLYNGNNQITEVQFPGENSGANRKLTFTYFGNRQLQTFKDAKGQGNGKVTAYGYDTGDKAMLLKSITYPKGNKIETTYNGNFKATQVSVKNASGTATATTTINPTIQYNSNGTYTTSTVSPENITTTYTFDKNGITTNIQSAAVSISSPTGNATHPTLPSSLTTNGETATPSYDSRGNILSVLRPDGATESFTYDAYNNLTTHTDAKGITTTYSWISTGKFLNSVSKPIGTGSNLSQTFTYQTNGLVATATNNEGVLTNFGYNAYGNVNQVQLPAASLTSTAVYDYASRLASATNALGRTTGYLYDANDNMTRETNALSQQTNYAYDDNDNLQTITNAMYGVTTLTYDAFDRLASEEFGGHTKTYSFDAIGRLAQYRKPGYGANNSRKFDYVYEAATGFLKSNGYIQNITYNGTTKNMSTIQGGTNASHTLSGFTYDNLNRLTAYTDHYGKIVGYAYDNNGNTTRIDYPNNNKVYYTYDNLNRMKTVMWNSTTVVTYNYVGSRLDNMVYGNGVKTEMTYDNIGRPTGMTTKTNNGNGSTIYSSLYTLDNVGNHTEENETQPYSSFNVPTAGTTSYSVGTDNRLSSISQTGIPTLSITHDGDGNITQKGSSTYSYDLEDNLSTYNGNGLNMTAIYDAFGNRRSVTRNGTETRYVLDINGLATVLAETNSSDVVQNYYIHGLGLAVRVKANGTIHYYHGDFRGSTVAMTNASQTITHKYQYDEFGNLLNSQEADPNPFRYVGTYGIMHETADLSYMRARYYDPTTGRFNSEDPIWSTNLFPYAGNNGVMNVDIDGMQISNISDLINYANQGWYNSKHVAKAIVGLGKNGLQIIQSSPITAYALLYNEYLKRIAELSAYGYTARYAGHALYITETLIPLMRYALILQGIAVGTAIIKGAIIVGGVTVALMPTPVGESDSNYKLKNGWLPSSTNPYGSYHVNPSPKKPRWEPSKTNPYGSYYVN